MHRRIELQCFGEFNATFKVYFFRLLEHGIADGEIFGMLFINRYYRDYNMIRAY